MPLPCPVIPRFSRVCSGYNTDLALRVLAKVMPKPEEANVRIMVCLVTAHSSCRYLRQQA